MIPREAGRGRSFLGAGKYYLHDKGASSAERVEFTHCENTPTQHPEKALKWMAWTAIHADELKRESGSKMTGRSCEKPVFTFSLSWHPEQGELKKWEMIGAGRRALMALGLDKHETVMVAHNDCDHSHLHLIVNVVDPETGKANRVSFSKKKLSRWAEKYEREHGKIYCEQRVENNAKRDQGEKVKYQEPEIDLKSRITRLYQESDSGAAFQSALAEHGFKLAKGKKIVLVDPEGKIHSLARQIDGVKEKEVRARLAELDLADVDRSKKEVSPETREERQATKKDPKQTGNAPTPKESGRGEEYVDRDAQDRAWQESIIDAAIAADDTKDAKPKSVRPSSQLPSHLLNRLQDRHLAELGQHYEVKFQSRLGLEQRLEEQYGAQERELRQGAGDLERTLRNAGLVKRLWLKATRQIPASAEKDLQQMRQTLENIEWRKREAQQALEADAFRRQMELAARHKRERLELEPKTEPARNCNQPQTEPDISLNAGPSLDY